MSGLLPGAHAQARADADAHMGLAMIESRERRETAELAAALAAQDHWADASTNPVCRVVLMRTPANPHTRFETLTFTGDKVGWESAREQATRFLSQEWDGVNGNIGG